MKFLFIEDNEPFFKWVSHPLEEAGHECVLARTLDEAEKVMAPRKFDAIFVDLGMPKYTEEQVLAVARALGERTPTIVLTGNTMRADLNRIADGFVFKSDLGSTEDVSRILPAYAEKCRQDASTPSGRIDQSAKVFYGLSWLLRHPLRLS